LGLLVLTAFNVSEFWREIEEEDVRGEENDLVMYCSGVFL